MSADDRRRWARIAASVAGAIAVLVWVNIRAEDAGYGRGQDAVYSDYSDLSYLATTEMCDQLERYSLEDLGGDYGDPSLVDDAVNLVLYAGEPSHRRNHADDYADYPDDLGRSTLGIKSGIVLEATAIGCPEYLLVVAEAVEAYRDYQSQAVP